MQFLYHSQVATTARLSGWFPGNTLVSSVSVVWSFSLDKSVSSWWAGSTQLEPVTGSFGGDKFRVLSPPTFRCSVGSLWPHRKKFIPSCSVTFCWCCLNVSAMICCHWDWGAIMQRLTDHFKVVSCWGSTFVMQKKKIPCILLTFMSFTNSFLVENFNFTWFTLQIYEISQLDVAIKKHIPLSSGGRKRRVPRLQLVKVCKCPASSQHPDQPHHDHVSGCFGGTVSPPACHRSLAAGGRHFGPQTLLARVGSKLFLHGKRVRLGGILLTSVIVPWSLPGSHAKSHVVEFFVLLCALGLQFLHTQKLVRNAGSRPFQTCWGSIFTFTNFLAALNISESTSF